MPVSIPLWDDWKLVSMILISLKNLFQFHYGMIGRTPPPTPSSSHTVFQFHYGMIGRHGLPFGRMSGYLFQFHYGMIGSFLLLGLGVLGFGVSIPLWDDWKRWNKQPNIPPMKVSIPLWDDWKGTYCHRIFYDRYVSIPLWDDWKF